MDNDLGFLLIFIILPTALIVSGFWFLLLIRKDARLRELSQTSTPEPSISDEPAAQDFADLEADGVLVIATLPDSAATEQLPAEPAPAEFEDEEEFWTDTAELEFTPDDLAPQVADDAAGNTLRQRHSGYTEEIEPVERANDDEPVLASDEPDEEDSVRSDNESQEQGTRRRRQPGARLTPSSENVKKRTGASTRRPPPIPKSSPRDEDTVERPDRSSDV